jgi:hypothetical protein
MEKNDQFRNEDKEPIIDELLSPEDRKVKIEKIFSYFFLIIQ